MKDALIRFWKDEEGATAIEYGLIAGLVAIAIVAALTSFGTSLALLFRKIGACLTSPSDTCFSATT